MLEFLTMFL